MWTVASINHVEIIPVEVLLSQAIPTTITVGLGVNTRMLAIRYTLGATCTSGFASGVRRSDDRRTITHNIELFHISKQPQISRYRKNLGLEEIK